MQNFTIKPYESDYENLHEKINIEFTKNWAWPHSSFIDYDKDEFDPDTSLSCFEKDYMVGFVNCKPRGEGPGIQKFKKKAASLDLPRVLPGYENVSDLLMEKILEIVKKKGVKRIRTRTSTMREGSIELAERWGFKPHKDYQLGYKKYYSYIEATNEEFLRQLLVRTINNSIDKDYQNYLLDLIDSLLMYEDVVKTLGLEETASWAIYEKEL